MYSTVGASEDVADIKQNVGVKCGNCVVKVCGNDWKTGEKRRVKDVVKMVTFCALQKFSRKATVNFGTMQASTC